MGPSAGGEPPSWGPRRRTWPDGSLRWSYKVSHVITGPPAVRPDGGVYFSSGRLVSLDPNGSLLWQWTPPTGFAAAGGSPAIAAGGTIYLNSYDPDLFAINPDG